jgi:hypothetical protein
MKTGRLEGCTTPYPAAFLWVVDISDEKTRTISSFQLEDMPNEPQPTMTGCHLPKAKSDRHRNPCRLVRQWTAHHRRC